MDTSRNEVQLSVKRSKLECGGQIFKLYSGVMSFELPISNGPLIITINSISAKLGVFTSVILASRHKISANRLSRH